MPAAAHRRRSATLRLGHSRVTLFCARSALGLSFGSQRQLEDQAGGLRACPIKDRSIRAQRNARRAVLGDRGLEASDASVKLRCSLASSPSATSVQKKQQGSAPDLEGRRKRTPSVLATNSPSCRSMLPSGATLTDSMRECTVTHGPHREQNRDPSNDAGDEGGGNVAGQRAITPPREKPT